MTSLQIALLFAARAVLSVLAFRFYSLCVGRNDAFSGFLHIVLPEISLSASSITWLASRGGL